MAATTPVRFNALVPELDVSNFDRSHLFYTETLGFEEIYSRMSPRFGLLSLGEAQLMLQQQDTGWPATATLTYPYGRGINFQIRVTDVSALAARIVHTGHALHRGIEESWRETIDGMVGEREILVLDPDGYLLRFSEFLGIQSKQM